MVGRIRCNRWNRFRNLLLNIPLPEDILVNEIFSYLWKTKQKTKKQKQKKTKTKTKTKNKKKNKKQKKKTKLKHPANIRRREFNPYRLGVSVQFVQYYKIFLPITSAKSYVLTHYISDIAENVVSFSCELHENDSIVHYLWSDWYINF